LLAAKTLAAALLPTAKSANGVTVVTTGGLVLLTKFVSSVVELTVAVFEMTPPAGAVTVKVRFVTALEARLPSDHVTVPATSAPLLLALK